MKKLYCPRCKEYLEGGDGDMHDCHCGWKQPEDEPQDFDEVERLERELAECKAALAIERECPPEMKDYALTYRDMELERDALAAQVLQMRDALELALSIEKGTLEELGLKQNNVTSLYEQALALDTKPAEEIIAKVKAEMLREAADGCMDIRLDGSEPPRTFANNYSDGYSDGCSECETKLRRMTDELERKE